MKKMLLAPLLLAAACTTTAKSDIPCNFSGQSFCLALGPEYDSSETGAASDFLVHRIQNGTSEYQIFIYEGNHPDLGKRPTVLRQKMKLLGEVMYLMEVVRTDEHPYTVLLKREDIEVPTRIHFTTDAQRQEEAIDRVLRVFFGCKEVTPTIGFRCRLNISSDSDGTTPR